jgi:hypothetical protein
MASSEAIVFSSVNLVGARLAREVSASVFPDTPQRQLREQAHSYTGYASGEALAVHEDQL